MAFPFSTKIHEAGHALGLVLGAQDFGYEDDVLPVEKITLEIRDGMLIAATSGLMLSAEMLKNFTTDEIKTITSLSAESIRRACEALDLTRWMRAKLVVSAMGPAAEARFSNITLADVLSSQRCQLDMQDMTTTCLIAGIKDRLEIDEQIDHACVRAEQVVKQDAAWEAITRLAAALPDIGSFDGGKAIEILTAAREALNG